ncbi:augmin complex subunit msd1 [Scaptodrosophila lebanonensis]|uniref:Augmin complex subunit msd1 n=1 Tax=Drosophila lebanonensis TaxID=7225 RepID=A0A6J2UBM5_DROLE|nr:augmin complex subunit msd1 [Scaptodrosophila lebanonensis]
MAEVIDEMLAGLVSQRVTMDGQVDKIGAIMEKSNKTLLHIESKTVAQLSASQCSSSKAHNVTPGVELSLVKILENFQQMMQHSTEPNKRIYSALDGCLAYRQRVENLGSSVRKLVALRDGIKQMKIDLDEYQQQQEEGDNELEDDIGY